MVRRGWGSHGSTRRCLLDVEAVGSHISPRGWLWGGEAGLLMAFPDTDCVGESRWFSFQSQTLVVGRRVGATYGSPRRWLWGERQRFLVQSLSLVVWGGSGCHGSPRRWLWSREAGVLMAVPDADCRGWKGLTLMAIPDAGC